MAAMKRRLDIGWKGHGKGDTSLGTFCKALALRTTVKVRIFHIRLKNKQLKQTWMRSRGIPK